jgi:hypothetical protein
MFDIEDGLYEVSQKLLIEIINRNFYFEKIYLPEAATGSLLLF